MILIYTNDSSGNAVSGSLEDLRNCVTDGKEIKVKITNAGGHTEVWSFSRCFVGDNGHVFAEAPLRIANFDINGSGVQTFSYYADPGAAVFGTNGKEIVKVGTSTYTNTMAMEWLSE